MPLGAGFCIWLTDLASRFAKKKAMYEENSYWLHILQAQQHKLILPRYLMCTKLAQVLIVLDESIRLT